MGVQHAVRQVFFRSDRSAEKTRTRILGCIRSVESFSEGNDIHVGCKPTPTENKTEPCTLYTYECLIYYLQCAKAQVSFQDVCLHPCLFSAIFSRGGVHVDGSLARGVRDQAKIFRE